MSSQRVSAVMVTWNSARDVTASIQSLINQSHRPTEITVVDNASSDGTADLVARQFTSVRLIRLSENIGFARGNNIGIEASSGDWILLLNPDAAIEPEWVERLVSFADNKERIGAMGGVLWRAGEGLTERTRIDSLGIEIYRSRRVRDAGAGSDADELPVKPERVFGICAAAALFRRAMLEDTAIDGQFLADRFFCYYEDADLAWRAWRRGWESWTIPGAEGFHRRGGSPVGSRFSRYHTHRNRLWMMLRNDRFLDAMTGLPQILIHELYMLARLIRYPYLFGAVWSSLSGVSQALRDRRRLPDLGASPIPFKPGIGFNRAEKIAALRGRKNISNSDLYHAPE